MPENPASAPAPQKNDDAAFLEDIAQAAQDSLAPEIRDAQDSAGLRALLPNLSAPDLEAVLKSLRNTGTLDRVLALATVPSDRADTRDAFQANVAAAVKQRSMGKEPLSVDDWIGALVSDDETSAESGMEKHRGTVSDIHDMDTRADRALERAKDIRSFDSLLKKHPEILGKLKAQGIDLDAEKANEQKRIKSENPGMPKEEAGARSAIAVYLRHGEAIRSAAPDESARKELDAGFERLKPYAHEMGIPYTETVRAAAGILPADKAAIIAATSGAGFDTRAIRKGDELRFESASDRYAQVWAIRPGERPEKSVEIPNGPRIRIATAPEPDASIIRERNLAIRDIEILTGWEGVRTPEGLEAARTHYPKGLEASIADASDAPNAWRAFALSYAEAGNEDGKALVSDMGARISKIADPELRKAMLEALDALAGGNVLGDQRAELLGEIGKKHMEGIATAAEASKAQTKKKGQAFGDAVRRIDDANARESGAMLGFQERVARTEAVARDNLHYFEENGFLALGPHFDAFLDVVNRNRNSVYAQAEADIKLPKKLTEKDRALMANGLVRAIGGGNADDYFDIPGYGLKRVDASGADVMEKIRLSLEGGVMKDGAVRLQALNSRLKNGANT